MNEYEKVCAALAARRCYESGQSVAQIAKSANKSTAVVRIWLKLSKTVLRPRDLVG